VFLMANRPPGEGNSGGEGFAGNLRGL